ncbi:MAG: hypothetical protein ACYS5V_15870, partial [Planctomycetota bacterium]
MGIDQRDVKRLPKLSKVLNGSGAKLTNNGVFLAKEVAGEHGLDIKNVGDVVYVDGIRCTL